MYNLTVAQAHTFFVGSVQWLVHNCPSVSTNKATGDAFRDQIAREFENADLNSNASYMYLDYNYYAWDVQGGRVQWLQAVQTNGSALRLKLEYAYDAAGNVDWIKDHLAGSPYQLQDFTNDLLNRLDAASASGGDGQGL